MGHQDHYIIRGAPIRCECGSHWRRIDLPRSHGSYTQGEPMLTWIDRVPFVNIPSFGICMAAVGSASTDEVLALGKGPLAIPAREPVDTYYDELGLAYTGCMCKPVTAKLWSDPENKLLIRGERALVYESFLTCIYGGRIIFEESGQNYVF